MKEKMSDVLLYRVRAPVRGDIQPSQLLSTGLHFYREWNFTHYIFRNKNKKSTTEALFCCKRISWLLKPTWKWYQKTKRTNGHSYSFRGMFLWNFRLTYSVDREILKIDFKNILLNRLHRDIDDRWILVISGCWRQLLGDRISILDVGSRRLC